MLFLNLSRECAKQSVVFLLLFCQVGVMKWDRPGLLFPIRSIRIGCSAVKKNGSGCVRMKFILLACAATFAASVVNECNECKNVARLPGEYFFCLF